MVKGTPDFVKAIQITTTIAGQLEFPEVGTVEERYAIGERKRLSVGTTDTPYTFTETPKVIIIYFEGAGCYYDFNKDATDDNSPKAPAGTFLTLGVKEVTKMVFKGVASLTVYILTLV